MDGAAGGMLADALVGVMLVDALALAGVTQSCGADAVAIGAPVDADCSLASSCGDGLPSAGRPFACSKFAIASRVRVPIVPSALPFRYPAGSIRTKSSGPADQAVASTPHVLARTPWRGESRDLIMFGIHALGKRVIVLLLYIELIIRTAGTAHHAAHSGPGGRADRGTGPCIANDAAGRGAQSACENGDQQSGANGMLVCCVGLAFDLFAGVSLARGIIALEALYRFAGPRHYRNGRAQRGTVHPAKVAMTPTAKK